MLDSYGKYKNIRDSAWRVLIDCKIKELPVSLTRIAEVYNINIIKNSEAHVLHEGEFGICFFADNRWNIVYDDTIESIGNRRFTIAHEIGHIILGHTVTSGIFQRQIDKVRPEEESEADKFAARILSPACVLWKLNVHSAEEIQKLCNISYTAATFRSKRMEVLYKRNKFLTSPLERKVFNQFRGYIDTLL